MMLLQGLGSLTASQNFTISCVLSWLMLRYLRYLTMMIIHTASAISNNNNNECITYGHMVKHIHPQSYQPASDIATTRISLINQKYHASKQRRIPSETFPRSKRHVSQLVRYRQMMLSAQIHRSSKIKSRFKFASAKLWNVFSYILLR